MTMTALALLQVDDLVISSLMRLVNSAHETGNWLPVILTGCALVAALVLRFVFKKKPETSAVSPAETKPDTSDQPPKA